MGENAEKYLDVKTSVAINDNSLSQGNAFLIDVTSSSTVTDDRSSGSVNEKIIDQLGTVEIDAEKPAEMANTSEQIEEMPKLIETQEPERPGKNSKFNLRKSLAWYNAFFTSDGVLDADELSTMIERDEKSNKNQLPGIDEEVYRSIESISTLESDNLTLNALKLNFLKTLELQSKNPIQNLT